ncbi:hypothetical protein RvY_01702 [Ramazzottius varieornatus]|uniref:BACK domain-containing protein n=1 Tax=Ramazzottius varieornatus TaxID=947166 RepID=A0A1D1UI21_RAMVA|nr:hypothetical protein RvY_01702 [Ramazzottius varieornatus]
MLSAHCRYWAEYCNETTGDACRMPPSPVELDFRRRVTGLGIRTVLNYLYSGRIKVDHHNCVEVFDAARALKIRDLTHLTERFIKVLLQDHNLWSVVTATRDKFPSSIFDIAWTKLATRFVRLSKSPEFKQLSLEDLIWFLQSDELLVSSEYQVFEAAMIWFKEERDARKRYFRRLMECVRFAYMTTDELVECMKYDVIFQEELGIDILCEANLAKLLAHENQQWSGYEIPPARRPDFEPRVKAFENPGRMERLQEKALMKTLDKRVSTNNLDLGKLFDKKFLVPVYHEVRASF